MSELFEIVHLLDLVREGFSAKVPVAGQSDHKLMKFLKQVDYLSPPLLPVFIGT
jgi:hypothetical protein